MYDYICQECGQGVVREQKVKNYKTKIKGYPFVVPEATIGICDKCDSEHFASDETKRWEEIFYQSLEKSRFFLLPQDIERVRKDLGLSMENFALLIGSTRQSLYNWEDHARPHPQSRMADLLMKLVDRSRLEGKVDIIDFLIQEAKKLGIELRVQKKSTEFMKPLILKVKQMTAGLLATAPAEKLGLAAEHEIGRKVSVVETEEGKMFGKLKYDYRSGALVLEAEQKDLNINSYRFELVMNDGKTINDDFGDVKNGQATLLADSEYTDRHVKEIRLIPKT